MNSIDAIIQKKIIQGTLAQCLMVAIAAFFSSYAQHDSFLFSIFAGLILTVCFLRIALSSFKFSNHRSSYLFFKLLNYGLTLVSGMSWGILAALDIHTSNAGASSNFLLPMIAVGNVAAAVTTLFYDLFLTRMYVGMTLFPHFLWILFSASTRPMRSFTEGYTISTIVLFIYVWRESGFANSLYWQNVDMQNLALQSQRESEASRAMATASAKMAAVGEMAGGIAHELNGPLSVLQGTISHLIDQSENGQLTPEKLNQALQRNQKIAERMIRITQGLVNFARQIPQDAMISRSLEELMEEVHELSQERLHKQQIDLRLNMPNKNLWCNDRGTQVSQTVLNLINNAIDALATPNDPSKNPWIEIDINKNQDYIHIGVTNNGPPIPETHRDFIFQPFFTTKKNQDGTGLGLSISRSLIENLGGELSYDKTSDHTRFVIRIPERKPATKPKPA